MVVSPKSSRQKAAIYLFLGDDSDQKSARISQIKNSTTNSKSLDFNYDILYSKDTSSNRLKESLGGIPVAGTKRLIIIRSPQNLSKENKEFILNYLKKPIFSNVIIFDSDEPYIKKGTFLNSLSGLCEVSNFQKARPKNSFDLFRAITRGDSKQALYILAELFSSGNKPAVIMGSIIGQFSQSGYKNKLKIYEEIVSADIAIKTGRVKPKLGLEILIVKLSRGFKKPPGKA